MRRVAIVLGFSLVAAGLFACKPKRALAPAPVAAPPPAEVVEETVDALTPPPPPSRPTANPTPGAAATLNGDPNGPKQADMNALQLAAQRKVQGCLDALPAGTALPGGTTRVSISYAVLPEGRAKDVTIDGDLPLAAKSCTQTAIEALPVAKFAGPLVRNSFTLTYTRPPTPDMAR